MPHKRKRTTWAEYPYVVNRKPERSPGMLSGDYVPSNWRTYDREPKFYPGSNEDEDAKATTQTLMLIGGLVAVVAIVAYLGNVFYLGHIEPPA